MNQRICEIEAKLEASMAKAMAQLRMKEQLLTDALANIGEGKYLRLGVTSGSKRE